MRGRNAIDTRATYHAGQIRDNITTASGDRTLTFRCEDIRLNANHTRGIRANGVLIQTRSASGILAEGVRGVEGANATYRRSDTRALLFRLVGYGNLTRSAILSRFGSGHLGIISLGVGCVI